MKNILPQSHQQSLTFSFMPLSNLSSLFSESVVTFVFLYGDLKTLCLFSQKKNTSLKKLCMCLLNTALVSNVYVSDKFTNILDYPPSFSLVLSCNSSWTDFANWCLSK
ncbi:unnamed protein product [Rangifer tarandus platyrhynchus]|uniref:Uncharacterized protein n=1 Tax=Rangifer tarandus platyrhynchus TaxID=3082113 RepID=A0AC59YBZ5_RANTA